MLQKILLKKMVHLLKSPANAARLLRSIGQGEQGELKVHEIVEPAKRA